MSNDNKVLIWAAAASLLALALRLICLGTKSLTADESFTYWLARLDWPAFKSQVSHYELNMLPYYVLMRGWTSKGAGEFAMRLPSAFLGAAAIPSVFLLGKKLLSQPAGLIAALLLGVHTAHIAYSQEARSYSLAAALCCLAAYFLLDGVRAAESSTRDLKAPWSAFVLSSVVAIYTQFFCVFVIMAFALALFTHPQRRLVLKRALFPFSMIAVGVIPIAMFAAFRGHGRLDWVPPLSWNALWKALAVLTGSAAALVLYGACIVLSWKSKTRGENDWRRLFLIFWGCVPLLCLTLISCWTPVLVDRFLVMSIPAVVLLAAEGLASRKKGRTALLCLLVLVSLGADARLYRRRSLQDCRSMANYVLERSTCNDLIVFLPAYGEVPFQYYADRQTVDACRPQVVRQGDLPRKASSATGVWLVWVTGIPGTRQPPNPDLGDGDHFPQVEQKEFSGFRVVRLQRRD
jgi:mannosyltransferase